MDGRKENSMTTLRDILNDLIIESKEIKNKAIDRQTMKLDDDLLPLEDVEEEIKEELLDEYIERIIKGLIG